MPVTLTCLLALLLALPCWAQSVAEPRPSVVVRYFEFPPFSFTNRQGQPDGSVLRLTRRLLEEAGYAGDIRALPSARVYAGLADGSVQLWPGAPGVPQLQDKVLEAGVTLGQVTLNLYYREGEPRPNLPGDLRGKRLILLNGYTYRPPVSDWLRDPRLRLQLTHTRTHQAALAMLERRRGDYLIDYDSPIDRELRESGDAPPPAIPLLELPVKLIYSRHNPQAEQLRDDLDRAYQTLREAGVDLDI